MPESPGHPPAGIESVVWNDAHVGGAHGWVEFVRVVGDEATLLVTPADRISSPLEAWRPMMEDLGGGDAYEWVVASAAWAAEWANNTQWPHLAMSDSLKQQYPPFATDPETPWPTTDGKRAMPRLAASGGGAARPWVDPTTLLLRPGETSSIALRLQLAEAGPRTRDAALAKMGSAVLRAVPGYVLSPHLPGTLFIQPPAGATVSTARADPPSGADTATLDATLRAPLPSGFVPVRLTAAGYGEVRLRVGFSDGSEALAHYYILPPFERQVAALGAHLADVAWLPREYPDPFGRSASVMPWDRSICPYSGEPCGHVLNDARAYDAGLSDDAGGGNPLCLAAKVRAAPTAHEASRVDEYIRWTLYGVKPDTASPPLKSLQIREEEVAAGEADAESVDGVRMTMFYYNCSGPKGAPPCSDASSGHFAWRYSEADKCHKPFGGPTCLEAEYVFLSSSSPLSSRCALKTLHNTVFPP